MTLRSEVTLFDWQKGDAFFDETKGHILLRRKKDIQVTVAKNSGLPGVINRNNFTGAENITHEEPVEFSSAVKTF